MTSPDSFAHGQKGIKDVAPTCEDVADKIISIFAWRHNYPVQKLQRSILPRTGVTGPDSWVVVRNLRSQTGGILDPDDRLRDVADDRETLMAALKGPSLHQPPLQPLPHHHHAGGDGASGSSVGTASPDIFRGGGGVGGSMRIGRSIEEADSCGVEVGAAELEGGTGGLQVRRGSEPTLNQELLPPSQPQISDHTKRWSAAVVGRDEVRLVSPQKIHLSPSRRPEHSHILDSNKLHSNVNSANNNFQRQANRLSMQFSGPGSGIWLDAADRIQTSGTKSLPRESARKEPLGQDTNAINGQNHRIEDMLSWVSGVNSNIRQSPIMERHLDMLPEVNGNELPVTGMEVPVGSNSVNNGVNSGTHGRTGQIMTVELVKGEKGLGFTITTRDNPTGGVCPIYIKNILPKGAAVVDGRLRAADRLVAVCGRAVAGLTQQAVVAALRAAPTNSTVHLVVERPGNNMTQPVQPQLSPPKFKDVNSKNSIITVINKDPNLNVITATAENGNRVSTVVNTMNQNHNNSMRGRIKKSASKDDILSRDLHDSDSALQDALNSSNTVLGLRNRMILRLDVPVHDSEKAGLGISVKGKVTVGPHPQDLGIFIKSVLNGGAASRDGRLHTNDQLLNVNGVSLVGQSNAEAMETLRRALVHTRSNIQGNISLTIARRTESMDSLSRWKDDTPPGGNESGNSTSENASNNSHSFSNQTVIYNSKIFNKGVDHYSTNQTNNHKSIVHLDSNYNPVNKGSHYDSNSNSNDSNPSNNRKHSSIITINNNNSWISNQSDDNKVYTERDSSLPEKENKRDSFEWGRLDGWNPVIDRLTGLRNESYYIATHGDSPTVNGHRDQPVRNTHPPGLYLGSRSPPSQHNVILEEDYGSTKAPSTPGVWESESESVAGGEGFSRSAVGRQSMSEKRHAALDARNTGTYKKLKEQRANNVQVGPSLGMRKSSSLESLQTAIQEVSLHNKHNMINMRRPDNFHSRAPLKHWLTDDHGTIDGIVRGSPQQSSLNHKKPSLLKSISTMFRIGKNKSKILEASSEMYGRSQPMRSSEKSISKEALERIQHTSKLLQDERNNLESGRKNDNFVSGTSAEGNERQWNAPPYRQPPARTSPHTLSQAIEGPGPWGGHYANYEEIQQNLNARREKLSEVQIGQMRRQVHAQRVKAEEESRRGVALGGTSSTGSNLGNGVPGGSSGYHSQRGRSPPNARPQSNYYEYETVQRGRSRDSNINISNANAKLIHYR